MAIWYLSRASLAAALNSVPGNQSGRYRTVQGFVSGSRVVLCMAHGHIRMGMTSTRNFPGAIADSHTRAASRFALRNGSSIDSTSIPYVMDNIRAPGVLRELVGI
jgi:hypothetical protein